MEFRLSMHFVYTSRFCGRYSTKAEKMACSWFGEILFCCSLTILLGPAWVLLKYVLQKKIFGSCIPNSHRVRAAQDSKHTVSYEAAIGMVLGP